MDPQCPQAQTRQAGQIAQKFAGCARAGHKAMLRGRVGIAKHSAHLGPHLKGLRAEAGAQPGQGVLRDGRGKA